MNTSKNLYLTLASFLILLFTAQVTIAQTYKINNKASKVKVEGTSNIHDWEIEAEELQGSLTVVIEDGQLVKIDELTFIVIAEGLKSGKGGMDKNTYKALNTNKYPKITYKLEKVTNIDCTSKEKCKVLTEGLLNIAGTKKQIDLILDAGVEGNKITLAGNTDIKMTDYNVEPPTAMFGTITTGDQLKIKFKTVYTK